MVAQVPAKGSTFTVYPYVGDLFAWLAVAGFVAITIWAVVRRRQAGVLRSCSPSVRLHTEGTPDAER
jgi:hypothetical protein